jgi:uncharacterized LabA/DUF88 family protein
MKKKVIFYFDGFNFYNGLKEQSILNPVWKQYYWIDFVKFCEQFISHDESELTAVKYFTSPPTNETKRSKQSALFAANRLLNPSKFIVIKGQHTRKTIKCEADCKRLFHVMEEKRTDVNIALEVLLDCMDEHVDTVVLVTADSDQIPTIQKVKQRFPKIKLKIYFPPQRTSQDIMSHVSPIVFLENNENKFQASLMTTEVTDGIKKYTRPADWKKP